MSFTYRKQIKVSTEDLLAARAGRKTCTIRLGTVNVAQPEIDLSDGRDSTRIRVTTVDHSKRFGDLGDREVKGEGFATRQELEADLKRYYRAIEDEALITVIWFEIVS
jgi:hypothetical protein